MDIIENGNVGLLVSLAAAISFAFYTTLGKLRIAKLGGNVENAFSFLIGCLFLLVILIFHGDPIIAGINAQTIWPLLYCSLVVTGFGYLFFMKAIELTGPSNASFAFFIKPIIALILAAIILSEPITANAVIGLALILLAAPWLDYRTPAFPASCHRRNRRSYQPSGLDEGRYRMPLGRYHFP
mgnify:CR=1 FL=1